MEKNKKPKAPAGPLRACESCGGNFRAKRRWQRYCSTKCRNAAWYREKRERLNIAAGIEDRLRRLEEAVGIRQS